MKFLVVKTALALIESVTSRPDFLRSSFASSENEEQNPWPFEGWDQSIFGLLRGGAVLLSEPCTTPIPCDIVRERMVFFGVVFWVLFLGFGVLGFLGFLGFWVSGFLGFWGFFLVFLSGLFMVFRLWSTERKRRCSYSMRLPHDVTLLALRNVLQIKAEREERTQLGAGMPYNRQIP